MNDKQEETNISLKEFAGKKMSANDLLKKLNLTKPPFNPFDIAVKLGLTVNQESTMDNLEISGSITSKGGDITIWINPFDIERRQRFTLAHELAHLTNDVSLKKKRLLEDDLEKLYRDGESNDIETKANKFAGELLMPAERIKFYAEEIIKGSKDGTILVRDLTLKLANIFEVTEPAMFVRLKVLGIVK